MMSFLGFLEEKKHCEMQNDPGLVPSSISKDMGLKGKTRMNAMNRKACEIDINSETLDLNQQINALLRRKILLPDITTLHHGFREYRSSSNDEINDPRKYGDNSTYLRDDIEKTVQQESTPYQLNVETICQITRSTVDSTEAKSPCLPAQNCTSPGEGETTTGVPSITRKGLARAVNSSEVNYSPPVARAVNLSEDNYSPPVARAVNLSEVNYSPPVARAVNLSEAIYSQPGLAHAVQNENDIRILAECNNEIAGDVQLDLSGDVDKPKDNNTGFDRDSLQMSIDQVMRRTTDVSSLMKDRYDVSTIGTRTKFTMPLPPISQSYHQDEIKGGPICNEGQEDCKYKSNNTLERILKCSARDKYTPSQQQHCIDKENPKIQSNDKGCIGKILDSDFSRRKVPLGMHIVVQNILQEMGHKELIRSQSLLSIEQDVNEISENLGIRTTSCTEKWTSEDYGTDSHSEVIVEPVMICVGLKDEFLTFMEEVLDFIESAASPILPDVGGKSPRTQDIHPANLMSEENYQGNIWNHHSSAHTIRDGQTYDWFNLQKSVRDDDYVCGSPFTHITQDPGFAGSAESEDRYSPLTVLDGESIDNQVPPDVPETNFMDRDWFSNPECLGLENQTWQREPNLNRPNQYQAQARIFNDEANMYRLHSFNGIPMVVFIPSQSKLESHARE